MNNIERVTHIKNEFEKKLDRKLSNKELDFISWMVRLEDDRKKRRPFK